MFILHVRFVLVDDFIYEGIFLYFFFIIADPDERMQNMEGKVLELEDKVIDLESDNRGLMEDKDKLMAEKNNLMEEINVGANHY